MSYNGKAILVSAIYFMKNKYYDTGDIYINYIKNMISYINSLIYIFVENIDQIIFLFTKHKIIIKDNIKFIEKKIEEFYVSKYNWENHYLMDPEKQIHNAGLYKIWNEKVNFVKSIIDIHPEYNGYFLWFDIGFVRNPNLKLFLNYFPDIDILKDKIYILRIKDIGIIYKGEIIDVSKYLIHFSAGIFGGHKDIFLEFSKKYYNMLDDFFLKNIFAGKEQNTLFNTIIKYPEIFKIIDIDSKNWMWIFQSNKLFYMLNYFISKKKFIMTKSSGGLGNILFSIISGYGYSRQLNRVYYYIFDTISDHSKVNYNNSLFKNFTKIDKKMLKKIDNVLVIKEKSYSEYIIKENINQDANYILETFLQNENYFIDFREDILYMLNDVFEFNGENPDYFIHVRRGDYLKNKFLYVDLTNYYKKAIDYIINNDNRYNEKKFFVFSDDIEWCEKNIFQNYDIKFKYINNMNEYDTLKCMVSAKYCGISSNSTFSWWGLWLNRNENFIKIIPKKWNSMNDTCLNIKNAIIIDI